MGNFCCPQPEHMDPENNLKYRNVEPIAHGEVLTRTYGEESKEIVSERVEVKQKQLSLLPLEYNYGMISKSLMRVFVDR